MLAAVVTKPNQKIIMEERAIPKPGRGEVLIRVHACGVCHGDLDVQQGAFPYTDLARYPIVPGHEITGIVEQVGPDVDWPSIGSRVGLPWLYSSCGHCDACDAGDETMCEKMEITGVTKDGGFQEYMLAPARHVTIIPEGLDLTEAAPLMCAGLTTFSGLRNAGFQPGYRVAVMGFGGLGHLGVLYAKAMGARVAVISSSPDKAKKAAELGVELFINSQQESVGDALLGWDGGADIILATSPSTDSINAALPGLAKHGTLVLLGVAETSLQVAPIHLILGKRKLIGSITGNKKDITDMLKFSAVHGIRPNITQFPLSAANEALELIKSGTLSGRAVLVMS